jgi:DnaJ domain
MTRRRAVRALDRIVRCQSLEELLACPPADRADVYEALREMRRPSALWRGAVVVTAFRRRVTPLYVEDRAATLLETASEIRRHDLYALFGVDPGVTLYDLRHRWRALAKQLHPDRASPAGSALFAQLRAAYAILSDPLQRSRYDDAWRRAHGPLVAQIESRPPGMIEDPGWRTRLRTWLTRPGMLHAARVAAAFAAGAGVVALLAVVWKPQVAGRGAPAAEEPPPPAAVALAVVPVVEPPPPTVTPVTAPPEQLVATVPAGIGRVAPAPQVAAVEAASEPVDGFLMSVMIEEAPAAAPAPHVVEPPPAPEAPPEAALPPPAEASRAEAPAAATREVERVGAAPLLAAPASPRAESVHAAPALDSPRPVPAPPARHAALSRRPVVPDAALQWAMRSTAPVVDLPAARAILDEFARRYAAAAPRALRELFASDGVANGRRGPAITRAYADRFERLGAGRTTLARVEFEPTSTGATVRTAFVLSHPGHPPIRGRATWELVREHDAVRVAKVTSTPPEL